MRALLLSLALLLVPALGRAADPLTPPPPAPPSPLPRLTAPLALDGDLAEWAGAAAVPMRSPAHMVEPKAKSAWQGPLDAGVELSLAWTEQGLCLAARVADDQVASDFETNLYQGDLLQFFLDGRPPERLLSRTMEPGVYNFLVRPPLPGKPALVKIDEGGGPIPGLAVAGRRTAEGYTIELFVPWVAFPGFVARSGSRLTLEFEQDDYDPSPRVHRQELSYHARTRLWERPDRYFAWELVDRLPSGPDGYLGGLATTELQPVVGGRPVTFRTELVPSLAAATTVGYTVRNLAGRAVFSGTAPARPLPAPWAGSKSAVLQWRPPKLPAGYYLAEVQPRDEAGRSLGVSRWPLFVAGDLLDQPLAALRQANLPRLAASEPFRALAWLGLGSAIEHVKHAVAVDDLAELRPRLQEVHSRLAVLQGRPLPPGVPPLYDLLSLTADPAAQVAVEYVNEQEAGVTFLWGAVPLVKASVRHTASAEEAAGSWERSLPHETIVIAGRPAHLTIGRNRAPQVTLRQYNPARQVLRVDGDDDAMIVPLDGFWFGSAVAILPGCPPPVADRLRVWAGEHKVPLVPPAEALAADHALLGGDPAGDPAVMARLAQLPLFLATSDPRPFTVSVGVGPLLVEACSPSRAAALQAAELIARGTAVTPAELDRLRRAVVDELAPKRRGGDPSALTCGDLHCHTYYTDGHHTPVGLALEAMYCGMDFLVMSDHNTITGGQEAAAALGRAGVAWPLIVGEEVTADGSHFNAYPLATAIPADGTLGELLQAAAAQGAVVQWNHPGWPDTAWAREQMPKRLEGTGLAAWEHVPDRLEEWLAAGVLPTLVGTSDTHSGTFRVAEQTVLLTTDPRGPAVAAAVKAGRTAIVSSWERVYLCGSPAAVNAAWAALADGAGLKQAKAARVKQALAKADIVRLLKE